MNWIPPEALASSRRAKIRETLLELLIKEKKEEITVSCGLKALDQIMLMPEFTNINGEGFIRLAGCYIEVKRDFELDPWEIWYNDVIVFE